MPARACHASTTARRGQSDILTNSGGASWRLGFGERSLGMLSATFSDSISRGAFPSHLRSLSAQGNVQTQLSGRASLTGTLNVVLSQQLSNPQETQTATSTPDIPASSTDNRGSTLNGTGQVRRPPRSLRHRQPVYTAAFRRMQVKQTWR
jgi:hypothetical protein